MPGWPTFFKLTQIEKRLRQEILKFPFVLTDRLTIIPSPRCFLPKHNNSIINIFYYPNTSYPKIIIIYNIVDLSIICRFLFRQVDPQKRVPPSAGMASFLKSHLKQKTIAARYTNHPLISIPSYNLFLFHTR